MKCWTTLTLALAGAATISGCAYFNGLYNANQLVKDAIRAEREGRIGEARSLWSRAAVKAESVAVRYSDSKHYDDALLLQGRALRAAGQCRLAVEPLQAAIEVSQDGPLLEEAHFLLGRCRYADGQLDSAIVSFSRALPSNDTLLASSAHLWRGRAYAELGELQSAIAEFRAASLVDAAFDLSIAYARLGRRADAETVLRWRVDGSYPQERWLAALDSVGGHLPDLASDVTELLLQRGDLARSERGNLLLRDGERWAGAGDTVKAIRKFRRVVEEASAEPAGFVARYRLLLAELRLADSVNRLLGWSDSLRILATELRASHPSITRIAAAVEVAALSLKGESRDDVPDDDWRKQNPDLEMFLAAEALRDDAEALLLAAALFEEIAARYPNSPLAPKALLAAAALNPSDADELVALVRQTYPMSPYTLVLRGLGLESYAVLEDSIRTLILARRGAI